LLKNSIKMLHLIILWKRDLYIQKILQLFSLAFIYFLYKSSFSLWSCFFKSTSFYSITDFNKWRTIISSATDFAFSASDFALSAWDFAYYAYSLASSAYSFASCANY
jgi:hypothetical protein